MDAEKGQCLLAALRSAAHGHLGFGTFGEYVERLLGYSPRSTHEKLCAAEALEGLPLLSRTLEEGALSWSALCELTRAAPVRAHAGARASQTIPPAVRRAVLQRDLHRCCVPGCKNATLLDVHHILPRREGGSNDAENLRTICGAHHRAMHRGDLIIEHGPAGGARSPRAEAGRAEVNNPPAQPANQTSTLTSAR